MNDKRQGIVHIIGPEQGFTQPGTIIVCGDSHTATHGAFGALAFGIGTSEVEHVLATQTLIQKKSKKLKNKCKWKFTKRCNSKRCNFKNHRNYWNSRWDWLCNRVRW